LTYLLSQMLGNGMVIGAVTIVAVLMLDEKSRFLIETVQI